MESHVWSYLSTYICMHTCTHIYPHTHVYVGEVFVRELRWNFRKMPPAALNFSYQILWNIMLYFGLWSGPKCHSRWCTGRKWHILVAVMRGNRVGGNWLMKRDEVKSAHGTLIDWRTGREWPLNCMTVISAWWRLNMRFQRSSGCWTII